MQIIRREHELWKLRVDNKDDLWCLARLCRFGRILSMLGDRRDQTTGSIEGGRAKSAVRKKIWISLKIEKSEFKTFSEVLRVHGIIEDAAFDKGSHHTHLISVGDEIELSSNSGFPQEDLELLDETVNTGKRTRIAICVVESDDINLYEIAMNGMREVAQFTMRGGGKYSGGGKANSELRNSFLRGAGVEIDKQLNVEIPLILCGPGQARDVLLNILREYGTTRKIVSVATSIGGRSAVNEVLREGLADELLSGHGLVKQIKMLEDAWRRLSTNGLIAYGEDDLIEAKQQGAIETMLILADLLRDENKRIEGKTWSEWIVELDEIGAKLIQCSNDHDAGLQLEGFGGAIALLRFKI